MDTKEMNIAIYRAIASKANELFQRVKISAGTYSAKELADRKKDKKALCWEMENSKEEITISVGSFVCHFCASMVFAVLARLEKLVPAKERVKLTKCEETAGLICSFTMDVPKSAIDAAKFVAKTNGYRPAMENVCIDIQGGRLAASDGYKMVTRPVAISNVSGELLERRVFIRPNDLKNMVGRCEVRIYDKKDTYQTEITTERGEIFICECGGRFPNVDSISWQPEEKQVIRFADVKGLKKIVKDAIKSECKLQLTIEAGSKSVRIISYAFRYNERDFEYIVPLSEPANYSCIVWIKPENLLPFFGDWTGELYIKSSYFAFVLGSKSGYNFLMPAIPESGKEIKDPEYYMPATETAAKQRNPSTELHAERMEQSDTESDLESMVSPIEEQIINPAEPIELVERRQAPTTNSTGPVSVSDLQIIAAIWLLGLFVISGRMGIMVFSPLSPRIKIPSAARPKILLSTGEIHIREPGKDVVTYRHKIRNVPDGKFKHIGTYRARGPDIIFLSLLF